MVGLICFLVGLVFCFFDVWFGLVWLVFEMNGFGLAAFFGPQKSIAGRGARRRTPMRCNDNSWRKRSKRRRKKTNERNGYGPLWRVRSGFAKFWVILFYSFGLTKSKGLFTFSVFFFFSLGFFLIHWKNWLQHHCKTTKSTR